MLSTFIKLPNSCLPAWGTFRIFIIGYVLDPWWPCHVGNNVCFILMFYIQFNLYVRSIVLRLQFPEEMNKTHKDKFSGTQTMFHFSIKACFTFLSQREKESTKHGNALIHTHNLFDALSRNTWGALVMFTLGPSQLLHQEREWYGTYNRDTVFAEAKWNICSLEKLVIRHMPEI